MTFRTASEQLRSAIHDCDHLFPSNKLQCLALLPFACFYLHFHISSYISYLPLLLSFGPTSTLNKIQKVLQLSAPLFAFIYSAAMLMSLHELVSRGLSRGACSLIPDSVPVCLRADDHRKETSKYLQNRISSLTRKVIKLKIILRRE